MATIQTSIMINDMLSQQFRAMNMAMATVIDSFQTLQDTSSQAIDVSALEVAHRELQMVEAQFNQIEQEIKQAELAQREFNNQIISGQDATDRLASKLVGIAATIGSFLAAGSFFKSGFNRLIGIDTAQAKLQALGHEAATVDLIMDNALSSVTGTAFRLEEAVITAASAVAAGIVPGQQLESYLSLVADTAAIAGTNMSEMGAIFNKITTSGMIQAEEMNQLLDRGIPIIQMLANQMGVAAEEVRKLASEGKISSTIFLSAVESGFGGAAQTMGLASFQATLDNIGAAIGRIGAAFLNGANDGQGFFDQVKPLMVDLLNTLRSYESYASRAGAVFGRVFGFFVDNFSIIAPIMGGATTALLIYTTALAGVKTATMIASGWQTIMAARTMLLTGATFAQTVAQHGLNAAMMASPITWVIMGIVALIAIIYAAVAAVNKFAGTSYNATGFIAGAFATLGAFIWNIVVSVINAIIQYLWTRFVEPWIGIVEWVLNVFTGGFNSFGDAVANLLGQIISWFLSLGKVVTQIIDAIFGTDWTAGLSSLQSSIIAWGKSEGAITLTREAPTFLSRIEYSRAWDVGYDWGANLFNFYNLMGQEEDYSAILDSVALATNDTAGNTKKLADSVELLEEDLKYLRDIAERETVNRFTTAEINIDMKNENHISSDMDIDGIIDRFGERVEEVAEMLAEGEVKEYV